MLDTLLLLFLVKLSQGTAGVVGLSYSIGGTAGAVALVAYIV